MKNADYWKGRMSEVEAASHKTGMEAYEEIEEQYMQAQRDIEAQIEKWYGRLAANNNISLTEARKMLTSKELAEFKWDVKDYIKHGEENALSQKWMKELENASARYHINRLEALKLECQQQIEKAFGNQLDTVDSSMRKIYENGYYHTAFEIQKGVGIGWDFTHLDTKQIDKVIHKPWSQDGKDFSSRIWSNKDQLVQQCNTTLTQCIIRGQDPQKAIKAISERLNVSKSNAGRLVMTESAAFSSRAQQDSFKELGVEEYEIVATLDSRTSEICQDMDGRHFKMSEYVVGETAPPFHPWCRSTTAPYFEDDFGSVGERAAKDESGNTYKVPGNMTYKEWKNKFVNGKDKADVKLATEEQKKDQKLKESLISQQMNLVKKYGSVDYLYLMGSGEDMEQWTKLSKETGLSAADLNEEFKKFADTWEITYNSYRDADRKKLSDLMHEQTTKQDKEALRFWTGGIYKEINEFLRFNTTVSDVAMKTAGELEKALNKTVLDRDIISKRGTNENVIKQLFPDVEDFSDPSKLEGRTFTDKGFCATTLEGEGFAGGLNFVVKCPKGTKAAYIADISRVSEEKEMLIQKNTTFKVVKAERVQNPLIKDRTKLKLWVEVVKQ